eukprot:3800613-Pyramimonas_sp.AAC.1
MSWTVEVATLKRSIVTEFSSYRGSNIEVYKAYGQERLGEPLSDATHVSLDLWLFVNKVPPTVEPEPNMNFMAYPPAAISKIHAHVFLHERKEWRCVELPNREGPTRGRNYSTVKMLKLAALKSFDY